MGEECLLEESGDLCRGLVEGEIKYSGTLSALMVYRLPVLPCSVQ